jgi:hypothetical protein
MPDAFDRLEKRMVETLRDHLAKGSSVRVPAGGDLIWQWFCDLSLARTWHASGPNPIGWLDLAAYRSLMAPAMEPRHVAILRAMDQTYISHCFARSNPAPEGAKILPPVSQRQLSAALFDAIMG